ncbi:MAG TPA: UDP-N-acetylglucosamine 2-epimerase [Gemmatimonadales bacterium]|nr:UDP-N-acetylglucosamine 2-epimerase [Gemmatimonadales bacterium]
MRRRRVCVVSTSRADFGGLRRLLHEIHEDDELELQLVVMGDHWAGDPARRSAGLTDDGLPVALALATTPRDDQPASIGEACGEALARFSAALPGLAPDVMVLLGDRFELMAPALAALVHNVPIAHLHGGELSLGAIDDSIRHALTKLARLHFVATREYADRVRQMGEPADSVFCVGAPALDGITTGALPAVDELERAIGLSFAEPVLLVTVHPVTREPGTAGTLVGAVLDAVARSGLRAVFTRANADAAGMAVNAAVEAFVAGSPSRYRCFDHLGQRLYFGCLRHCAAMVGNSSSGLVEAPSFRLPAVNVGHRQDGRVRAASVIDTAAEPALILAALARALDPSFRASLGTMTNPYDPHGDGQASRRIVRELKAALSAGLASRKRFADTPPLEISS